MLGIKVQLPWKVLLCSLLFCTLLATVLYPVMASSASEIAAPGSSQPSEKLRTIQVTGSADVMVAPDQVDITVGVETRSADFQKAKSENDENAKKVINLTRKYGIDPKYVQSDYFRAYPSYQVEGYSETSKVSYYNVQKRIVLQLREMGKFEDLTADLLSNGSIQIQNIEFRSTELSKYKNEARKLAIKAAKDKAQLLTGEIGSRITKPVSINEEQLNSWTWYGSWWWGSSWFGYNQPNAALSNVSANFQNNQMGSGSVAAPGQDGETVSVGQIRITAKIGVSFEMD